MSHVSCEPDVVHILDRSSSDLRSSSSSSSSGQSSSSSLASTSTTLMDSRPLTIQTFKLEPGGSQPQSVRGKVKLEPGILQTLPTEAALATPLKVEIQDNYLDSGQSPASPPPSSPVRLADIEGALIIADSDEMALTNMTLDYFINDNGTCTCKLCGEVTASRTHWYRHKYKVSHSHHFISLQLTSGRSTTSACSSVRSARCSSRVRRATRATSPTDTRREWSGRTGSSSLRRRWRDLTR